MVPTVLNRRLPKASGIHASLHICLHPVAPHPPSSLLARATPIPGSQRASLPYPPPCSLGSEANVLRSQQRDIAARQAARQAAKDAYKLSLERTAGFRALCSGGWG